MTCTGLLKGATDQEYTVPSGALGGVITKVSLLQEVLVSGAIVGKGFIATESSCVLEHPFAETV